MCIYGLGLQCIGSEMCRTAGISCGAAPYEPHDFAPDHLSDLTGKLEQPRLQLFMGFVLVSSLNSENMPVSTGCSEDEVVSLLWGGAW